MAAAALGRAVVDDYMRNDASYVSDALREHLHRVFARVGRRCCGLAAGAGDHAALLDVLRARPVAFREAARDEQAFGEPSAELAESLADEPPEPPKGAPPTLESEPSAGERCHTDNSPPPCEVAEGEATVEAFLALFFEPPLERRALV